MKLFSFISKTKRDDLKRALRMAIYGSIQNGLDEPSTVAELTFQIPTYVNQLNLIIGGFTLTVGGVFIHQTPKVTFSGIVGQNSIEIGDLLLISTIAYSD